MNKALILIRVDNCIDCPYHKIEDYPFKEDDDFAKNVGCFCTAVETNKSASNGIKYGYKCVAWDDTQIRRWTQVPDWCPFLDIEED